MSNSVNFFELIGAAIISQR